MPRVDVNGVGLACEEWGEVFPLVWARSLNLAEPETLKHQVLNLLTAVEAGKWCAKSE